MGILTIIGLLAGLYVYSRIVKGWSWYGKLVVAMILAAAASCYSVLSWFGGGIARGRVGGGGGLGGADVYVVLHDIDDEFCVAAGDGRDRDVDEVGESVVAEEREGGAGTGDEATTSLVAAGGGIVVRLGNVQCTVRSTRARSGGADGASQDTFPHRFALRPARRRDQERAFPEGNRTTHQ